LGSLALSYTEGSVEVYEEFHEFHRSVKKNFHANRRKGVFNFKLYNKCKYCTNKWESLSSQGEEDKVKATV
jgi:hypothetical protein